MYLTDILVPFNRHTRLRELYWKRSHLVKDLYTGTYTFPFIYWQNWYHRPAWPDLQRSRQPSGSTLYLKLPLTRTPKHFSSAPHPYVTQPSPRTSPLLLTWLSNTTVATLLQRLTSLTLSSLHVKITWGRPHVNVGPSYLLISCALNYNFKRYQTIHTLSSHLSQKYSLSSLHHTNVACFTTLQFSQRIE